MIVWQGDPLLLEVGGKDSAQLNFLSRRSPVTKRIPNYLKLHVEPLESDDEKARASFPGLAVIRRTFETVTGWSLRYLADELSPPLDECSIPVRSFDDEQSSGRLLIERPVECAAEGQSRATRAEAFEHAVAIAELLGELQQTRKALWQREAELAAGVPVVERPDEVAHLAARLEAVLKGGAEAIGCQGAALYMLDEATSQLKLRACWGIARHRFVEPARPLRDALVDLEALLGHAVVLDDTSQLPHWNAPERFLSAVCVPVSTPTMILGTLWAFADQVRNYKNEQVNVLEIVAGRVAAELEREMLLEQSRQIRTVDRQLTLAAQWQQLRLPKIHPLLDDWQIAAWAAHVDGVGGCLYDWTITSEGRLGIALGQAQGCSLEAALNAASLQTAVRSHTAYRHTAGQLLDRVNETLWTASAGDQMASLFYALMDPEKNIFEFASAGQLTAVVLRFPGCELIASPSEPLGTEPDRSRPACRQKLGRGEALIVWNEGVQQAIQGSTAIVCEDAIAATLSDQRGRTATELADAVRALIDTYRPARPAVDRTLLVLRHG